MSYVMLMRGGPHEDVFLWLIAIGLLVVLLGGKWLGERLTFWVRHRRMQHQWPFR